MQLFLVGCGKPSPVAQNAIDLLSIKVSASDSMEFSTFNQGLAAAIAAGETWPQEPVMVVRKFLPWGVGDESVLLLRAMARYSQVSNLLLSPMGWAMILSWGNV